MTSAKCPAQHMAIFRVQDQVLLVLFLVRQQDALSRAWTTGFLPPKKRWEEEMRPSTVPGARKIHGEGRGLFRFQISSTTCLSFPFSKSLLALEIFATPDESIALTLQRKNLNICNLQSRGPTPTCFTLQINGSLGQNVRGEAPALDWCFYNCKFMGGEFNTVGWNQQ